MILDDALVAPGHEDEVLDAGLVGFADNVLDQRPVDDRQHFLWHGLGGRKEPSSKAGDGKNGFADTAHEAGTSLYRRNGGIDGGGESMQRRPGLVGSVPSQGR